jgi:hypothetical protein
VAGTICSTGGSAGDAVPSNRGVCTLNMAPWSGSLKRCGFRWSPDPRHRWHPVLDRALAALAAQDERKARALEMRLFGGLSFDEIGAVLDVSGPTVHRDVRFPTAWLHARLEADAEPPTG